jgi:hypothetical protein
MIFLNPPRDQTKLQEASGFDLKDIYPLDGFRVFEAAKKISDHIVFYLPSNVKMDQVSDVVGIEGTIVKSGKKILIFHNGSFFRFYF